MSNSRGRPAQPQQQLGVSVVPASFHKPGRRRCHEGLWHLFRNGKRIGGCSPYFGERGLTGGQPLKSKARLSAKVRPVKLQDAEEGQPSIGVALELVVPIIRAGEPPVNNSHDARATTTCFNGPLRRNRSRLLFRLGDETPGWIPCLDSPHGFHSGT